MEGCPFTLEYFRKILRSVFLFPCYVIGGKYQSEFIILIESVSERGLRPSNAKMLYLHEKSTEIGIKEQNNRRVKGRKIHVGK